MISLVAFHADRRKITMAAIESTNSLIRRRSRGLSCRYGCSLVQQSLALAAEGSVNGRWPLPSPQVL
jgi:hypothetical protein